MNRMRLLGVLGLGLLSTVASAQEAPGALSDEQRAEQISLLDPLPSRCVLNGDELPRFEFKDAEKVRALIGSYTLKATFYDSDYTPVTAAARPGRHGAVVEIIPADPARAPATKRLIPLYRLPTRENFAQQSTQLMNRLKALRWNFDDNVRQDLDTVLELAALHELKPGETLGRFLQARAMSAQWWVGLKRKLYGFDQLYPKPFAGPRPLEGKPATVIHEGTLAEAGMKPDASEKIDAVLSQWVADSDQGFDVCIVRHGVVVLHKAYGKTRRGQVRTTATKTNLTSTSKLISGSALMMLVDAGFLDLDAPVTDLPGPLHGLKTEKPVTLYHLYTHTSGFAAGGSIWNDNEERCVPILPHVQVGRGWEYNSLGIELAWSLASMTVGQTYPNFAEQYLLAPLGCESTELLSPGGSNDTTSLDMARLCQMLLNRGAYGNLRFFTEAAWERMLPCRLTRTLGPDTDERAWGIGTHPWPVEGLSDLTFGHAGYTKCTVCIDPANDLAIVMLRDEKATNFNKYNGRFLQAVVEGLVDGLPVFPRALALGECRAPLAQGRLVLDTEVQNPGAATAVIEYEYDEAGTHWRFAPDSKGRLVLPPGGKAPLHIEAQFEKGQPAPMPKLWGSIAHAGQAVPKVEYGLQPRLERRASAVRLLVPPSVDGMVAEIEYGGAKAAGGFQDVKGRRTPPFDTEFVVAYDDKALYVAVTAYEKDPGALQRTPRQRDEGRIRSDDCIELILDAAHDRKAYRHFVVNLGGAQLDALGGDSKNWNAVWGAAVKLYESRYVVELAIPYEALGVAAPKPGDTWGMNICRNRTAPGPRTSETYSQWVMSYDTPPRSAAYWYSYDNPDVAAHFGELVFR